MYISRKLLSLKRKPHEESPCIGVQNWSLIYGVYESQVNVTNTDLKQPLTDFGWLHPGHQVRESLLSSISYMILQRREYKPI